MIIKKIEIGGFGKFTDTALEFDKGMNLVYGNNEDGKTTLMAFVKMMLYSSSAKTEKSADLFKALRKKYRPWNGAPMSGALEFEWGGMLYRLQKEFLKSDASDKTTVFCITTGENIYIENKNEPGEHFLGMNLEEFERSIFMGQGGGFTAEGASDSLAMRISNLSVSGDEGTSHEQILKRLSDAAEELVSKSRKKGLLVDAEAKLEQLKLEKEQLLQLENLQREAEAEISKLTREIAELEADIDALSHLDKIENAKKDLQAYYTLQNKLNLLKAVKIQLAAYDAPYEELQKYTSSAKELNGKIEANLSLIQEATLRQSRDIPEEECNRLLAIDSKCAALRGDLETTRCRITALWAELEGKTHAALKAARLGAFAVLLVSILSAFAAYFTIPYGAFVGTGLAIAGLGLSAALFLTARRRSMSGLAVQLCKRDYEGAVRGLTCFEESLAQKNPTDLEAILQKSLADTASALQSGLDALGLEDTAQLKSRSGAHTAESIKNITNELAAQKEDFVALSCTIRECGTYSAAKILFTDLEHSLNEYAAKTQEIQTICTAAGIENSTEEFVADKIKTLSEIVQNAPIRPADTGLSLPKIRTELLEKRTQLSNLQARIKRPEKGLSELLNEIKAARDTVSRLQERYDEISIAIEVMNEAIADTNKGLGSHLSQKVGQYISKITEGKYSDVLVPRDLSIEARSAGSQSFHQWKYLSCGAIDKAYLALRLAMADILAEGHGALPLFLDDILSQYDDDSCMAALRFLKEYINDTGSVSQIMFFTCHSNILKMAKNVFADSNEILL